MKRYFALFIAVILLSMLPSCHKKETVHQITNAQASAVHSFSYTESEEPTNYIKIEMVGGGIMLAELYPEAAPITVENFKRLVSEKFYDGLIFHRVIKNFMIQGGDIDGDGYANPGVATIVGEFASNGYANPIRHTRGVLSMARSTAPNSASTQFFIMHQTKTSLDGNYAAFGEVFAGLDVVDAIANVKTDSSDRPTLEVQIQSIRFITLDSPEGSTT